MIISVILLEIGKRVPVESGAGGIRTLVQTVDNLAFYMLIL